MFTPLRCIVFVALMGVSLVIVQDPEADFPGWTYIRSIGATVDNFLRQVVGEAMISWEQSPVGLSRPGSSPVKPEFTDLLSIIIQAFLFVWVVLVVLRGLHIHGRRA